MFSVKSFLLIALAVACASAQVAPGGSTSTGSVPAVGSGSAAGSGSEAGPGSTFGQTTAAAARARVSLVFNGNIANGSAELQAIINKISQQYNVPVNMISIVSVGAEELAAGAGSASGSGSTSGPPPPAGVRSLQDTTTIVIEIEDANADTIVSNIAANPSSVGATSATVVDTTEASDNDDLSDGEIIGVAVGVAAGVGLIVGILLTCWILGRKKEKRRRRRLASRPRRKRKGSKKPKSKSGSKKPKGAKDIKITINTTAIPVDAGKSVDKKADAEAKKEVAKAEKIAEKKVDAAPKTEKKPEVATRSADISFDSTDYSYESDYSSY